MSSISDALVIADAMLEEAAQHAREVRWKLSIVKNGVVAPLKDRDNALATLRTIEDAQRNLHRLLLDENTP